MVSLDHLQRTQVRTRLVSSRRVGERLHERCPRLRARQSGHSLPDGILRGLRRGHVLRVRRDPFDDLVGVFVQRRTGEALVPRRAKRKYISNGGYARRARGA
jgi:hypothetical protein